MLVFENVDKKIINTDKNDILELYRIKDVI